MRVLTDSSAERKEKMLFPKPPWVRPPSRFVNGLSRNQAELNLYVVHIKTGRIGKILLINSARKRNLLLSFDAKKDPRRNGQQNFYSRFSLRPATEEETALAKELENA